VYRRAFSVRHWRFTLMPIACIWLIQSGAATCRFAAAGYSLGQEGVRSIVVVTALDANGRTTTLEGGFFVRDAVVATGYQPIKNIKDVTSLRVKVAGRDQLEAVKQIAAFDERLDIALLLLASPVGTPYAVSAKEQVTVGEPVYLSGATNGSTSKPEAELSLVGNIKDNCYLLISPRVSNAEGSPVTNAYGRLIGMIVRSPEPNENFIYAVHVSSLAYMMTRLNQETAAPQNSVRSANCLSDVIKDFKALPPPPPPPPPYHKSELPKVIRKSGGVLQQSAVKQVAPEYPVAAIEGGVSGTVAVEITVDEQGEVVRARAITGPQLLKEAALAAARQWKFKPTRLSGVPVKVIGTITFNFNL
jgi:TonB family protein